MVRICLIACLLFSAFAESQAEKILVTVFRTYTPLPATEKVTIVFDWKPLSNSLAAFNKQGVQVTDTHFGKIVPAELVDTNGDSKPDQVAFNYEFMSNEPIWTFAIEPKGSQTLSTKTFVADNRFQIGYLIPSSLFIKKNGSVKSWPGKIIQSTMLTYPDPSLLSINAPGKWNYEYGFFMNGTLEYWKRTKNDEFYKYVKQYADHFIDENGMMSTEQYDVTEYKLDDILPGRMFLSLYEETKDPKYKIAVDRFKDHLLKQPKTSDGGYWHKQIYPNQMWLDGIFMGDVFSVHYASQFKDPELFDEAIKQIKLIAKHTTDPSSGLMYHAWDESINKVWAHPQKGTSPEFWARAIGWYAMALVQCLDYIPKDHPERKDVVAILQSVSKAVLKVQDPKTKLWFQVIDKGGREGNWIETSASAMFAYAFAKGANQGLLDKSYGAAAKKAFDSLIKDYVYFDNSDRMYLDQTVKVGTLNFKTSKGDYEYYIGGERRINDYKGLSALIYASLEIK